MRRLITLACVAAVLIAGTALPASAGSLSSGKGAPTTPGEEPGGEGRPPAIPCTGVGDLTLPTFPVRQGSIYTPATDSFASALQSKPGIPRNVFHSGTPDPAAQSAGADWSPQFSYNADGKERLRVQAAWGNTSSIDVAVTEARVWLWSPSYGQAGPFKYYSTGPAPAFRCYKDHPNQHNLGYLDAQVPLPAGLALEPGFNVRVEIVSFLALVGADQNNVHIGAKPADAGAKVENGAMGAILDDNAVVESNGRPDDIESILKAQAPELLNGVLPTLNGKEIYFDADDHEKKLSIHHASGNIGPGDIDVALTPTTKSLEWFQPPSFARAFCFWILFVPVCKTVTIHPAGYYRLSGESDDESHLRVTLTVPNLHFDGVAAFPPVSADVSLDATAHIVLLVRIDTNGGDTAPFVVASIDDAWLTDQSASADIHQAIYDLISNEDKLIDHLADAFAAQTGFLAGILNGAGVSALLTAKLNEKIKPAVDSIRDQLAAGFALPQGSLGIDEVTFDHTCERLGCDGVYRGDVLLSQEGLEVSIGAAATGGGARFPKAYRPAPPTGIRDHLGERTSPDGLAFDAGVLVEAGFLDQILRVVSAGGLLDVSGADLDPQLSGGTIAPEVAPMYVPSTVGLPGPAGKLQFVIPNLQLKFPTAEFAVDVRAYVDATGVPGPGPLQIQPTVDFTFEVHPLWCVANVLCGIFANPGPNAALNQFLHDKVLQPLVDDSLGTIGLPQLPFVRIVGAEVSEVGGHVGVFADVDAAPAVTAQSILTGPMNDQSVVFSATAAYFPQGVNPDFSWSVEDHFGTVVATGSGPSIQVPAEECFYFWDGVFDNYYCKATVTATGGGFSAQATTEREWRRHSH